MQRFLSIRNFEKYQHYKFRNPPWFKIHKCMFGDPEFMKLSTHSRFLYIGLIHLAVESDNKIYNDRTFIGQRLYIPHTEVDLTPLYRAGFLLASNISRECSEKLQSSDRVVTETAPKHAASKKVLRPITEEDRPTEKHKALAQSLGVDLGAEWGKFKNYCLAHDKRYANFEAAFRNWIANSIHMRKS